MSLITRGSSGDGPGVSPAPPREPRSRRRPHTAWDAVRRRAVLADRAARRHWTLTALLTAGLVLRVMTQVAYRPALIYIDTVKYVLSGWEKYDPEGYRYLLVLPVTWAGNLAVLAAVQHLLGLAMGAVLYAVLIRRGVPRWASALAAAPVLLDGYQLQAEQTIMPDVLFEALIAAGLAILLWKPRPGPWLIALASLVLGVSATVRQVGEALVLPACAVVVLAARGWRQRLGRGALAAVYFAMPIFAYMTYSAVVLHDHFELSDQGDAVLYGRTAEAADCAALRIPAYERPLCPTPREASELGVDWLVNNRASPVNRYSPPPGIDRLTAIKDFSYHVLEQQPLRVAGAIARDAVKLFAVTRHTDPGDTPIWRWQFQDAYPLYPPGVTIPIVEYMVGHSGGGGSPVVVRPLAAALRDYQLGGGYTPGPYLLAALLAGAGGILTYRRGHDATLALAALLVTGTAVAVLLGADVYEFSWRYQLPALVTLPAAGALGMTAITERTRLFLAARKSRDAGSPGESRDGEQAGKPAVNTPREPWA